MATMTEATTAAIIMMVVVSNGKPSGLFELALKLTSLVMSFPLSVMVPEAGVGCCPVDAVTVNG